MSKMGYNACTIGNHEFDNGLKKLSESLKYANFSFINSNYVFKNTPIENRQLQGQVLKTFIKGKIEFEY